MNHRSFAEILYETLNSKAKVSPREKETPVKPTSETIKWLNYQTNLFTLEIGPRAVKQGQYGQKKTTVSSKIRPNIDSSDSSHTPRAPAPAHSLNELQQKAFEFFVSHGHALLPDFYDLELKSAYRKLALKMHPDTAASSSGCESDFISLKKNYEILKTVFKK